MTDKSAQIAHSPARVLLVDGFNLVRRIYEARPDDAPGDVSEAATKSLQRALRAHQPSHGVVIFEDHDRTWRHLLYADYKADRKPTPAPLLQGIPAITEQFEGLGMHTFSLPNYEADDVIATLTAGIKRAGGEALIVSTDKSYLQLLGPGVRIFNHFNQTEYIETDVVARYDVKISQLTDYWALMGDSSNNVKGVPKIGKKSAAELLHHHRDLEAILLAQDENAKVRRVQANAALARRCKQLVTLKQDVELGTNLKAFRLNVEV